MIPILGMVLGNTISGISLGLVTTVEELMTGVWVGVCAYVPDRIAGGQREWALPFAWMHNSHSDCCWHITM